MNRLVWILFAAASLLCAPLHAGNLKVNLAPAGAVSAGAQWRVDGGAWRASGTTVSNLSNTTHVVNFKATTGWITPADISVALTNGNTTTVTGTYVSPSSLKITLTPTSGQWRIDGGTWRTSGTTVGSLAPGAHTIDYLAVSGYSTPTTESVTLVAGQTTTLARAYVQLAQLTFNLTPSTGQWNVDGGAWRNSGTAATGLAPGAHTVAFAALTGYTAPPAESVTLSAGQALTLSRAYTALSKLAVTLTPASGKWRIDGGAWITSGTLTSNLTPGSHTMDYQAVSGFITPAAETVTLISGQTTNLSRTYVQLAQLTVTLTAPGAQWRVDGGAWLGTGATATGLTPGNHTLEFSSVAGYVGPASETIGLSAGQALTITRNYTALAQLGISLSPATAQWRVDGGAWQASGTVAANLSVGSHTIDYSPLNHFITPPSESVTLTSGQTLNLSRTHEGLAQVLIGLVPATGQWRLNGGAWNASGTEQWVPAGNYTVEYSSLPLYDAPANDVFTLPAGGGFAGTRNYTSQKPTLTVNLGPSQGQWRIDGGAWVASGATVSELAVGAHTLEYLDLGGIYLSLPSEPISLDLRQHASITRSYPLKPAEVSLTLTPATAQWRIYRDGISPGEWIASGATVTGLIAGNYTIEYQAVENYVTPASETLVLSAAQSLSLSRNYAPLARLSVVFPGIGKWRVDGGYWLNGGTVVNNLTPGDHAVEYLAYEHAVSPENETVSLTGGELRTLSRAYVQLAQVLIGLVPSAGQWRLNGGAWNTSGTSAWVPAGNYTIEYSDVPFYDPPAGDVITLTEAGIFATTRYYVSQRPTLSLSLLPNTAQWRIDGGAWNASGATLTELDPGAHTVEYTDVGGDYSPLAPESLNLALRDHTVVNRAYALKPADATVTLHPATAQWRLYASGTAPTGTWNASGATLTGITPGAYTLEYGPLANHDAPATESVTLSPSQSLALDRSYTPHPAQVSITLTPASAQWQIHPAAAAPDGIWRASGATVGSLTAGDYTLTYQTAPGYVTPAAETVSLAAGTNLSLARSYVQLASISVTLEPAAGQWRLDGGAWNASGATQSNLSIGAHTLEYSSLADYTSPANETVTLASGTNPPLTRSYVSDPAFALIRRFDDAGNLPNAIKASDGKIYVVANTGSANGGGNLFRINPDGTGFERLKSFGTDPADGLSPKALIEGSDGKLYGTTAYGPGATSTVRNGRVYRINKDGTGYQVLRIFNQVGDGEPNSLMESNGLLYGTTSAIGTSSGSGSKIYVLTMDGSNWGFIHGLSGSKGVNPQGVVMGDFPYMYGVARSGGSGYGTIFRASVYGIEYSVLKTFTGLTDGSDPRANLLLASDGMLYGSTYFGGSAGRGVIFRINRDGTGYQVLHHFLASPDGGGTEFQLVEDSSGVLYGCTLIGGTSNRGTFFRMNKDGTGYSVLRSFSGLTADGGQPKARLVSLGNSTFLGVNTMGGDAAKGLLFTIANDGSGFTPLKQLGAPEGSDPKTGVTADGNGVLYGTTALGGTSGTGSVFRINENGTAYSVLAHLPNLGGGVPYGRLLLASDGALYGTIFSSGILYKVKTDGSGMTILQNFSVSNPTVGLWGGVIEGSDGFLYGAGSSVVFRIAKDGSGFTSLHTFAGGATDGSTAMGQLYEGPDGRLYGNTNAGGSANAGVIFALNKNGSGYAILHHFLGGATDGSGPWSEMIRGSDGALYGTTYGGGSGNLGTIFKVNPDGTGYSVLRIFSGTATDGSQPSLAGLLAKDGYLYGATMAGGAFNKGTIYRLHQDGSGFEILVNFGLDANDASTPYSGVVEGADGHLYGTTVTGGGSAGTIFRLRLP